MTSETRWTPEQIAERLPEIGVDRLPMFEYIEMMQAKAAAAEST